MKKQVVNVLSTGILGVLMSCAHGLKPATLASNATPADEIKSQNALIEQAYTDQVDVLAPDNFEEAMEYYTEAKEDNMNGTPAKEVLESVAYSRSYLEKATKEAQAARSQTTQIIASRKMAIEAGARKYPSKLNQIDKKLMAFTDDSKISISLDERNALQDEYLKLELHAIMQANLGSVKNLLKQAKDKNAEEITPGVYSAALEKYTIAEKVIETNRHDTANITKASKEATVAANRVLSLLASEKVSRNMSPEQRAINLETKNKTLKDTRSAKAVVVAASLQKDEVISDKNAELADQENTLAASENENDEFKAKAMDEAAVKNAAARFDSTEADVYRQDGVLIIRLKSMNFATSRSDLPATSLAVLAKVKEVIKGFGAGSVTVEGHTDGMGEAKLNQKLSEQRAQSVVKYFTSDDTLVQNKINSVGYGYSKPLGTNKTSAGRSLNRRVDILITPDQSI